MLLAGCAGHTSAVDPITTTNSSDLAPVIGAGSSGSLRVFPVATNEDFSRPIALGSDGTIWFGASTASGAPELGRIDLTGTSTYFPTESGIGVITGIANGPEGDVWFTSLGGDANTWKIGKMTTRGRVIFNEVLPKGFGANANIALGSDGDVWFPVAGGTGKPSIAKSTKAGVITIYRCSFCSMSPTGVALGSDGNIWFTFSYAGAFGVGEVTPNGTMTEYPAPANEVVEANPVLGHDGRIWFSVEDDTDPYHLVYQVGAIDTGGTMAFYAIPDQQTFGGVNGLTPGPDGRVWYSKSDKIGGVDSSGTFSNVLTVPTTMQGDEVELLTTDAVGDAWFAQETTNALGEFKP